MLINIVALNLERDEFLLQSSVDQQVESNLEGCQLLMQERKYTELIKILDELSPLTVVIINFKLSLQNKELIEESGTLVKTFLPYLKECIRFDFIKKEYLQIGIRILNTLVQYYLDTQETIDPGLALYALQLSPNKSDQKILQQAFIKIGFKKESSIILCNQPQKFLWPELIGLLLQYKGQEQEELINIFSKINISQNPAPFLVDLIKLFAQRKIFTNILSEIKETNLSLQELLGILETLKSLETEKIRQCFEQDSKQWIQKKDHELEQEQIEVFLKLQIANKQDLLTDQKVFEQCSKSIEKLCDFYQHNPYQAAISQVICSQNENHIIVEMPTGSGKTWIQAIISKFFINKGTEVVIIEPNENLKNQTLELLQNLDHNLSVTTIADFYEYPPKEELIIVNEYDLIFQQCSFNLQLMNYQGYGNLKIEKFFFYGYNKQSY